MGEVFDFLMKITSGGTSGMGFILLMTGQKEAAESFALVGIVIAGGGVLWTLGKLLKWLWK